MQRKKGENGKKKKERKQEKKKRRDTQGDSAKSIKISRATIYKEAKIARKAKAKKKVLKETGTTQWFCLWTTGPTHLPE